MLMGVCVHACVHQKAGRSNWARLLLEEGLDVEGKRRLLCG